MITKKIARWKVGWTNVQNCLENGQFQKLRKTERLEINSSMSETKAASAECTIRSLKNILYSHTMTLDTRICTNRLQPPQTRIPGKNVAKTWFQSLSDFWSSLCRKTPRENIKSTFKMETDFTSPSMIYLQEGLHGTVFTGSFRICGSCFLKTTNIRNKGWKWKECTWWILSKRVDQNNSATESFTIQLVSNESAQLYTDKILSSALLHFFCQNHWIWRGNGSLQFQKYRRGEFMFLDEHNFQIRESFTI